MQVDAGGEAVSEVLCVHARVSGNPVGQVPRDSFRPAAEALIHARHRVVAGRRLVDAAADVAEVLSPVDHPVVRGALQPRARVALEELLRLED